MSATTTINFKISKADKEEATILLEDLGLNMSTYLNMSIKQLLRRDGVPFEVERRQFSEELREALEESDEIVKEIRAGKGKGYRNMNELFAALKVDDEEEI